MNKVGQRLLTFFLGVPAIVFIVCFDFYNHLLFQIISLFFCVIGTIEFYNMISNKIKLFPKWLIVLETITLPIFSFISILYNISSEYLLWLYILLIFILLVVETFSNKTFENSLPKIAYSAFIIFYTGFLLSFVSRLTSLGENSTFYMVLYFIFIFMCDSGAWFFGILFGKKSRGVIAASPNKSAVGFIGGIITSIAMGIFAKLLFPEYLPGSFWKIIIVGFVCAIAAITGDLIESVFKRSCGVKDSGKIVPGRGGALDCMDSLLIGAPAFYISMFFLYFV